jgi:hypothetical protein
MLSQLRAMKDIVECQYVKRKAFLDRYGSAFIQTADDAKAIFAIMDIDKGYQRLTQIDPFSQPIMKSGPL